MKREDGQQTRRLENAELSSEAARQGEGEVVAAEWLVLAVVEFLEDITLLKIFASISSQVYLT